MIPELITAFIVLFQMMCVVVVFAYLVTRTRFYSEILEGIFSWKNQLILILIFGIISIYGSESGIVILGAPLNIRDLGPMVAGFVGGPLVGLGAGMIGAGYRMTMGGFSAIACSFATILAGLLAGLINLANKRQFPGIVLAISGAILIEGLHMGLVLLICRPLSQAVELVSEVAFPMIAANAAGMFIFAFITLNLENEKRTTRERDRYQAELQRKNAELQIAREIQESFLPASLPSLPGYSLAAESRPAREVGGDFYDVLASPRGRVGLVIADVSDKGVPAALFMALSTTVMRASAAWHQRPRDAVSDANALIARESSSGMFVTLFFCLLDPGAGTLTYVNAGHNPPLLVRKNGEISSLTLTGIALGVEGGALYEERSVDLGAGDLLVLYTDGVTEAEDPSQKQFGEERLAALVRAQRSCTAGEVLAAIQAAVSAHTLTAPQYDDMTLVVLKVGS
ncbi:MAG: SpoIIE family protein phosphatase [Methanolinea sp.]|jgi:sigma-B regulation protein RsbU (phosphoserine phosphatase)|nr:SpoIIE family protein phosphatase [Methanolinea sp.]